MTHTSSAQSREDGFGFYKSAYKQRCVCTLKTLVCFSPRLSIILLRKMRLASTKRNIFDLLPLSQASSRFNSTLISFFFHFCSVGGRIQGFIQRGACSTLATQSYLLQYYRQHSRILTSCSSLTHFFDIS